MENKNKKNKIFNNPVIYTKCIDSSTLVLVEANSTIRYIDIDSLESLSGFKLNIEQKWYKSPVASFSDSGDHFALVSADAKYSTLYSAKTKKAISKVERNRAGVSCLAIDPGGKYFFSCGESGKTFVVDIKTEKLSFTIPGHIDAVNDIAFSPNKQNVATAYRSLEWENE